MGTSLSASRARYLAAQSREVTISGQINPAPLLDGDRPSYPARFDRETLPWHIRHLAAIFVTGVCSIVMLLATLVVFVISSEQPRDTSGEVMALAGVSEKLAGVIEKMIDSDLQEKDAAENKMVVDKAAMIFWIILAGVFLGVSSQYAGPWGIGVALFIIVLIIGVSSGFAPLELIRTIMGGN